MEMKKMRCGFFISVQYRVSVSVPCYLSNKQARVRRVLWAQAIHADATAVSSARQLARGLSPSASLWVQQVWLIGVGLFFVMRDTHHSIRAFLPPVVNGPLRGRLSARYEAACPMGTHLLFMSA